MHATLNLRTLKAVALAASSEETRYYLKGVCVELDARGVTYAATNGHILIAARDDYPEQSADTPLTGRYIIPLDVCSAHKLPRRGQPAVAILEAEPGGLLTDATLTFGDNIKRFNSIDGTFPDWRRVCPSSVCGELAQFDAGYLAAFQKAANIIADEKEAMRLDVHHNGNGPAVVKFGRIGHDTIESAFGVIMPTRAFGSAGDLPTWVAGPQPEPMLEAAE